MSVCFLLFLVLLLVVDSQTDGDVSNLLQVEYEPQRCEFTL
jgi:hypothetical protein